MNNLLKHVPGFRSNNKRNMIIATIYFAICVYMIPQNNFVSAIVSFALPFLFFFIKDVLKKRKNSKLNLTDEGIEAVVETEPVEFSKRTMSIAVVCMLVILGVGAYNGSVAKATEAKAVIAQKVIADAKIVSDNKAKVIADKQVAADKIIADKKAIEDKKISDAQAIAENKIADAQAIVDAKVAAAKVISDKKAADEAAAKAAADQAAAAQALKAQYDTGITYNQLARTPDSYVGKKVKLSGKVVQVIEGASETDLRIAVGGDYDTILLVAYNPSIVTSRILENDNVTVKGVSQGITTYKSTMGGDITIPLVTADSFN